LTGADRAAAQHGQWLVDALPLRVLGRDVPTCIDFIDEVVHVVRVIRDGCRRRIPRLRERLLDPPAEPVFLLSVMLK
jgi:hypothetical protein